MPPVTRAAGTRTFVLKYLLLCGALVVHAVELKAEQFGVILRIRHSDDGSIRALVHPPNRDYGVALELL